MISVGMMDRKIAFKKQTVSTSSSYGGVTNYAYVEAAEEIWAHVIWRGGVIGEDGDQMQNNQIVEFYVRNAGVMATDATVKDRIEFDSDIFYIDSINVVDGRKKYLQILKHFIF